MLMHWAVVAPNFDGPWLTPFVPGDRHRFSVVPAPRNKTARWDARSRRTTRFGGWCRTFRRGRAALAARKGGGIITIFPQLAATVGLQQQLSPLAVPTVAWSFNLGQLYDGPKRRFAKLALRQVDVFVVHAKRERERYSSWLGLPEDRFVFSHLQKPLTEITCEENDDKPFVLAMGSANRDYRTFFEAVRRLKVPTVVVAGRMALDGLEVPSNVQVKHSLSYEECRCLSQRARINVVPLRDVESASGQITVVDALCMKRCVVATRCIGTEDYIDDGVTGWLFDMQSVGGLTEAIEKLWHDRELRVHLALNGYEFAKRHCTDEAAGRRLGAILDTVAMKYSK